MPSPCWACDRAPCAWIARPRAQTETSGRSTRRPFRQIEATASTALVCVCAAEYKVAKSESLEFETQPRGSSHGSPVGSLRSTHIASLCVVVRVLHMGPAIHSLVSVLTDERATPHPFGALPNQIIAWAASAFSVRVSPLTHPPIHLLLEHPHVVDRTTFDAHPRRYTIRI
jgi:hypothetical protein